jgi:hypothetical protein
MSAGLRFLEIVKNLGRLHDNQQGLHNGVISGSHTTFKDGAGHS